MNLLMSAHQTPDVSHEESWWQLSLIAYAQLFIAKEVVPSMPQKWERYLPEYKIENSNDKNSTSPSKTQRGFSTLLNEIGTPARPCIARGKPLGRSQGDSPSKREETPIIFKGKKAPSAQKKHIILGSGDVADFSNPKKNLPAHVLAPVAAITSLFLYQMSVNTS